MHKYHRVLVEDGHTRLILDLILEVLLEYLSLLRLSAWMRSHNHAWAKPTQIDSLFILVGECKYSLTSEPYGYDSTTSTQDRCI